MEWFFRYGVGLLYILMASVCLLEVNCIVFEINNMDVNRVIYIGLLESDVKMTCSAPYIINPQFEILHGPSQVQNLKFTNQSVELTISRVQPMDGGEYTCRVSSMDSTDMAATASLTLNVQSGGTHCFYNDSSLNWNEGETKQLSCFYPSSPFTNNFQWKVSNSSSSSFTLMSSSLYTDSNKRILFASIGPLQSSDDGNIYQCLHSMDYPADTAASCMFGPITVNPIVATTTVIAANTNPSSTESLSRTESTAPNNGLITNLQSTPQVMTAATSKVQSSPLVTLEKPSASSSTNISTTTEEPGPISMLVLVIIAVVCAVIVLSCMICLIVVCKCRSKNNEKENDSKMMANQVYDPFDGYLKPDAKVLPTKKTTHPMTGSKSDVATETPLDGKNQVGDEYDKLDHDKERLHNHTTRPVAAARSSLNDNTQNDNEYDKLDHNKEKHHGNIKPQTTSSRGGLGKNTLSDEKNDVAYDTIRKGTGKVKGQEKPADDTKFEMADAFYDKVNTHGLGSQKGKRGAKIGDTGKTEGNLDMQELYAKIDKTRSLERSKAKQEQRDDAVLY